MVFLYRDMVVKDAVICIGLCYRDAVICIGLCLYL